MTVWLNAPFSVVILFLVIIGVIIGFAGLFMCSEREIAIKRAQKRWISTLITFFYYLFLLVLAYYKNVRFKLGMLTLSLIRNHHIIKIKLF